MNNVPNAELVHRRPARTGVMLVNLGTPEAPTAPAIRRYLRQFLSDPRVVEVPRWIWLGVLNAFILPFRPRKLVHAYAKVWTEQGSPLMAISEAQRRALAEILGEDAVVELAMCYGQPSIAAALERLDQAGVQRILFLPLYPQYSGTTTAAALDALFQAAQKRRWVPELRTVNSYHDRPAYIEALANSVEAHWARQGRGDHLLISFHSIPRSYLDKGDPYFCQCHKTARLLSERLQLAPGSWSIAFQSRLGRQPWLQPYTDIVVPQLAQRGHRTLDLICPGFSADCLETLEEVAIRYAEDFRTAGGADLRYIPALNADAPHIAMLAGLCREQLQGWTDRAALAVDEIQAREQRVAAIRPSLDQPSLMS